MKINQHQKGFSAIELVVVIAIAGSLIVSAIGAANNLQSNAKVTQAAQDVGSLRAATSAYAATQGSVAANTDITNDLQSYLPGHLRANAVAGSNNTIVNPFGGTYVVGVTATSYSIFINGIPADAVGRLDTVITRGGLRGGTSTPGSSDINITGMAY